VSRRLRRQAVSPREIVAARLKGMRGRQRRSDRSPGEFPHYKESRAGQPGGYEMRNISRRTRDKTKLASPVSPWNFI
jgi:hypothetical protein